MRIRLVAIGNKLPQWIEQGSQDYLKRLPREFAFELIEIPLGHRGKNADIDRAMRQEGQAMLKHVEPSDWVVALEILGKNWSSEQLADNLNDWQMRGQNIVFLIGGPEGLAPECKQRADQNWSLSNLTLPHPLVRVIFAESLYRAWTITVGHPYHRGE